MKLKAIFIFCFSVSCVFVSGSARAELSVTSQWWIEESARQCRQTNNVLVYPQYWGESVTDENRETVCMAEQFARFVADEGGGWLDNKAVEFIRQCKDQSKEDGSLYYPCLQKGVEEVTQQISKPCRELGQEGLWEEERCRRLVSYIFTKDFDEILKQERPLIQRLMDEKILKYGFSPIAALIFLLLYVLDLVFIVDHGHWARVPKFSLFVGVIILSSWFLRDELHFAGMGAAVIICLLGMIFNHLRGPIELKEKKGRL